MQNDKKLKGLEKYIKIGMDNWKIPGLAISVSEKHQNLFTNSYGYKDIESEEMVDANTVFCVGSVTKSFTAMAIGILVDEGKLEWDKPIIDYIPEFEMYDEFATKRVTIIDLLSHRTGLAPHNNFWYGSNFNRHELFERIKFLEPAWDFRTNYQYQNLTYMVAGSVIEKISGMTWEMFIKEKIFKPLKMTSASICSEEIEAYGNYAKPYKFINNKYETFELLNIDTVAPSGGINMNIKDFAKWADVNLYKGEFEGVRIISEKNCEFIQQIHMYGADLFPYNFKERPYTNYGLGWFIEPYKGQDVIYVGGNIEGYVALSCFLPNDDISISIQMNKHEANFLLFELFYYIIDNLLDLEVTDWQKRHKYLLEQNMEKGKSSKNRIEKDFESKRLKRPAVFKSLESAVGTYHHPGYGKLEIFSENNMLKGMHNGNVSQMKYFHDGSFELSHYDRNYFDTDITILGGRMRVLIEFKVDGNNNVESIKVPFEKRVKAIEFIKENGEVNVNI